ncbi:DSPc-domain-containing protein [Gloeopeniophorella convolvens]|nr:DSPc-domain-containing protein [Gloeopeniophorella convolvens]
MISFAGLSPEVAEAMCTPMHLILPPSAATARSPLVHSGALYLGSISAVLDPSILKEHNIHHLVQVLDVPWLPSIEKDGYECYRMDILDVESQDLKPHLEDAVEDIDSALRRGQNVLVHCQQGVSRSAAIVIAYLIRKRGMSFDSAIAYVRQRRPCIKPNSGFVRCLQEWENQWRPHSKAVAWLEAVPSLSGKLKETVPLLGGELGLS